MNRLKLNSLRDRYLGKAGNTIYNNRFAKVADILYGDGQRQKPYAGISTLLDAPMSEASEKLDVALAGVPLDLGVTNRPGARFGPRAVRTMERVGPYHFELDVLPFDVLSVADIGDVPFESRFSLKKSIDDIESFYDNLADQGIIPLSVGGDHSITYPIMKAIGRKKPLGMVHIDAHFDTAGELEGENYQHGGPFRMAVLDGVLDPDRSIQIGIRGSAGFVGEFSYESGMTIVTAEEFQNKGPAAVAELAKTVVGNDPFYVTIDVDGFDPSYAPGTGTPEIGGLSPREVQCLLRSLRGLNVVGGDVVEVAPQYDSNSITAHLAAQMLFEILSLVALNESRPWIQDAQLSSREPK